MSRPAGGQALREAEQTMTVADGTMVPVSEDGDVTDNQAESRFELRAAGHLAELVYRRRGNRLVLVHTEVPPELAGQGIGGRLVAAAVERAARQGLTVVPLCPFARQYLERRAGEAANVAIDWGGTAETSS
jgi:predicted GNAT family acetyltransferase